MSTIFYTSGFQSVLRETQGIRDYLAGIRGSIFVMATVEFIGLFNERNILLEIIAKLF
jgi:hypothetical protein